ncbi:malonic semialdehyde reductase [Terasakiella sp. A23]|uniref:malonic semialdehyde reductase n=1 Tax=Terasakiella sp. FCG-A23 TaxID=3080561 RepID=UPI00295571F7|nr:malonic semialdehyde reductase [Terasakiella sp. A23]MDV7338614.1 malonic semialdehyde reductase [Terasakiella sp. A23]
MSNAISQDALNQLFFEARTHNAWQDKNVPDELLAQAWETARWAPTSMNCNPTRVTFLKSKAAKEKLKPCLSEGNIEKTMQAPVCAIISIDPEFYVNMPRLFPSFPGAADMFEASPDLAEETAFRNGTLQGAYFMIACRSLGLDCGPMSGFDNQKLDEIFYSGSKFKSNFLCNIGYGDKAGLYDRNPRPAFDEVCTVE